MAEAIEAPADQVSNNFGGLEILRERRRTREQDEELVEWATLQDNLFLYLRNFAYAGITAAGLALKLSDAVWFGIHNAFGAIARQNIYDNLPVPARDAFWTVAQWCYEAILAVGRAHREYYGLRRRGDPFRFHRDLIQGQSDIKLLMTVLTFLGGVGVVMRESSKAYKELMQTTITDKDRLVSVARKALKDVGEEVAKRKNAPKELRKEDLVLEGLDISTLKQGLLGALKSDRTNGKMQKSTPAIISPTSNAGRLFAYILEEDDDRFPLDRNVQLNDGSAFVYF